MKEQEGIEARIWIWAAKKKSADQLKATKQTTNLYNHLADCIPKLMEIVADCIGMGLTLPKLHLTAYRVKIVYLIVEFSKRG